MCLHGHIVDLTALQAVQETAGMGGVASVRQALVSHSMDRVRPGPSRCRPPHQGSAHVVVDGERHGGARLWAEKIVKLNI